MSTEGGLPCAVERASRLGATALQLFVKSARQWRARTLGAGEVRAFREAAERTGLAGTLVAHAGYLINPASRVAALRERSLRSLAVEIDRCARLGVPYLVLHPGSYDGPRREEGLRRVARGLHRIYHPSDASRRRSRARVRVLLEITAGQGHTLGRTFEELGAILDRAGCGDRLGVCFDTCHALAAGYEFRDARAYRDMLLRLEATVGLDRVRVFHLNDSRHALGSRRDRHEHIGRGFVGLEAFRLLLNDRRFRDRPMVLETPKGADMGEDRVNLAVLRAMIGR